ncbi:competence protein CoiA family protein [Paenibacillus abyssi]
MEFRIDETNQRSDVIVIHPNGDRWAIEFQCSKISGEKWPKGEHCMKKQEWPTLGFRRFRSQFWKD